MTGAVSAQQKYAVRSDWGPQGAASLAAVCAALVVVDVLSFTTCVDVAVGRGATVAPLPRRGAVAPDGWQLASRDRSAPLSLSPASLATIAPGTLLALPSPNGATIAAAAAATGVPVFAGCLRNAEAVAAAAADAAGPGGAVGVVAAGERWPADAAGHDALRPAFEDLIGAGAIADALVARHSGSTSPEASPDASPEAFSEAFSEGSGASPEAMAAIDAWHGARRRGLAAMVRACASGQELISWGHAADVEAALRVGVSAVAPRLTSVGGVAAFTASGRAAR